MMARARETRYVASIVGKHIAKLAASYYDQFAFPVCGQGENQLRENHESTESTSALV